MSGRGGGGYGDRDRLFTLTNGLIAMNALLYGAQVLTKDAVTVLGAKVNSAIIAGQWWRFITPAFLHGSVMHLVVNSYSLYNLAPLVESLSGGKRLFLVYMTAAVAGNVASFYGSALPSLGASGAVFGVGGALAVYFYRNRELYGRKSDYMLKSLWQTLLFNLLYGFANPRIDNWYVNFTIQKVLLTLTTTLFSLTMHICLQGAPRGHGRWCHCRLVVGSSTAGW